MTRAKRLPVPVTLKDLGPTVYLPSALWGIGQGAIIPVIVLTAVDLHASLAIAGLMVSMLGLGQIVGDIPGGWLIGRIGERRAMLATAILVMPAIIGCITAPSLWLFGLSVLATGVCGAVWNIARQSYVTEVVPYAMRARALSTLAGVNRVGKFLGPFAGAAAMSELGTDGAYWVHLAVAIVAVAVLLPLRDMTPTAERQPAPAEPAGTANGGRSRLFRTLGVGVIFVGAMRASRQAVIPLWAAHLGLSATTTSLLYGLGAALEMALFYPGGSMMDRLGRRWVAAPAMLTLGIAHALLPLAHGTIGLGVVSLLMGVGNGISSGIIMTLGADVAPATGRAQFLGTWRLFSDVGNGAGPVATSGLVAAASLTVAVLGVGALGLVTAVMLYRWIPRTTARLPVATPAVSS